MNPTATPTSSTPSRKHWFLLPALEDPFYVCGGWQIFRRAAALVGEGRDAEVVTYRRREEGTRYLDDIPREELADGMVWVTWQSHVIELARRLAGLDHVVLYAQNTDFGRDHGQVTPPEWPIVCLSRFIAADYAVRDPWRALFVLPPVLHPEARNPGGARDIPVLVHQRKNVPYVRHELVPALREHVEVEVLDRWMPQEEFLALLGRSCVYLYWMHRQVAGVFEGFGMQPLEAAACGAVPISNAYGGLGDYLEAPLNSLKIGTWNRDFDIAQIVDAVARHDGANPDEARLHEVYGEAMFHRRFARIDAGLELYFDRRQGPRETFTLAPPPPPLHRRPYEWLYRKTRRAYKRWRGILPT